MNGVEFVEVDPTGRYGRYDEILGKGSSKTVYRAFDEYDGIEVAWNQVKLYDFLQSPEDLERLYCEIHLLKTLRHGNIMKFYSSWVDTANRNINFVTEMFTSGTLRQYRLKHRRVNIRAVKHWCRQILQGLVYLHSLDPPVIHRDLKCDNIFINGNQGQVKIGDLGLAAILRKSHAACCVGTPEFMAPEVYKEEYNELVDIYSFGMCVLEMVTLDYPYSECTHPAQIYKKVISGIKPEGLYEVNDPEVRQFVEKCLVTVSCRLPAKELLKDPFLQIDDHGFDLRTMEYHSEFDEVGPYMRQPLYGSHHNSSSLQNGYSNYYDYEPEYDLDHYPQDFDANEIETFTSEDEQSLDVAISIKGRREDNGIFLRLRIADKEGQIRNIFFPFDIETDTALSVVTEMVSELDITDQDVTKIAEMIDDEVDNLVPGWKRRAAVEEDFHPTSSSFCSNCASGTTGQHVQQCSQDATGAIHGRFEQITYHRSNSSHHMDIWDQDEPPKEIPCDEAHKMLDKLSIGNDEKIITMDDQSESNYARNNSNPGDNEDEIRHELRWLKAKYQMQLRDIRDQELGGSSKSSAPKYPPPKSIPSGQCSASHKFPVSAENRCANMANKGIYREPGTGSFSPEHMGTANNFYAGALLPKPLHRATSLPVDAVDF